MSDTFDPYYKWLAIPPKEQPPDHYRLLGIKLFESDADVIANAADQRMAHLRTFQTGKHSSLAQKLLNEIAAARICLLKPDKKAEYDRGLRAQRETARSNALAKAAPLAVDPGPPAGAQAPAGDLSALGDLVASYSMSSSAARKKQSPSLSVPARAIGLVSVVTVAGAIYFFIDGGRSSSEPSRPLAGQTENRAQPKSPPALASAPQAQPQSADAPAQSPIAVPDLETATSTGRSDDANQSQPGQDVADASERVADSEEPSANSTADDSVDLLSLIKPSQHVLKGQWQSDSGGLVSSLDTPTLVEIPYEPPAEYDLQVRAARSFGDGCLTLVVIGGGRQFAVVLNGWRGSICGVDAVNGRGADVNETRHLGAAFTGDQPVTVTCAVRKNRLVVLADERAVINWSTDFSGCSLPPGWKGAHPSHLALATFGAAYRITRCELTSPSLKLPPPGILGLVESAPPMEPESPGLLPDSGDTLASESESASWGGDIGKNEGRQPLPDDAAQRDAIRLVRQVFQSDLAKAKTPSEKAALAGRMMDMAAESNQDADEYALLNEAQELALAANRPGLAARAVAELGGRFQIDAVAREVDLVERLSKRNLGDDAARELIEAAGGWADAALDLDQFDAARRLLTVAVQTARKAKLVSETKSYTRRGAEVAQLQKQFAAFQSASDRVAKDEEDGEAQLEMGRFLCFGKRRWDQGLPHLARGTDSNLQLAAAADLAKPVEVEARIEVGDTWWSLADHDKLATAVMRERALHWYRRALPETAGLPKAKIEKRISQLDPTETKAAVAATSNKPTKARIRRRPDRLISQDAIATPSSVASDAETGIKFIVKPALLTDSDDDYFGQFSFSTAGEPGTHITIDLRKSMMVTRMLIRNRLDGYRDRAKGLTVWASNAADETPQEVWRSTSVEREWTFELTNPVEARYIKVGLPLTKKRSLHLSRILVFGYDVPRKSKPTEARDP